MEVRFPAVGAGGGSLADKRSSTMVVPPFRHKGTGLFVRQQRTRRTVVPDLGPWRDRKQICQTRGDATLRQADGAGKRDAPSPARPLPEVAATLRAQL